MAERPLERSNRRRLIAEHTPERNCLRGIRGAGAVTVCHDHADVGWFQARILERQFDCAAWTIAIWLDVKNACRFRGAARSEKFTEHRYSARLSVGSFFQNYRRRALAKHS